MNIADLAILVFTLAGAATLYHLYTEAKKASKTAKAWTILGIGAALLLLMVVSHFTGWILGRKEIRDAAANTEAIAALKPLAEKAPAFIGMHNKLSQNDAAIAEVRKDLGEIKGLITSMNSRFTNATSDTVAEFRSLDGRMQRLEAMARNGSGSTPTIVGDRAVIQPAPLLPPPALEFPAPTATPVVQSTLPAAQTPAPPVAAPPTTAPAPVAQNQPNLREQLEASWQKRLDALAKQSQNGVKRTQGTAEAAQRSANDAMATARAANNAAEASRQLAITGLGHSATNAQRITALETRANETEATVRRLLTLLENPNVTVPVTPAYKDPPATTPTAPATAALAPTQGTQVAMRGATPSDDSQPIGDEYSFTVTNTVPVRAYKPKVGFFPWWEGATITYEVDAAISRTNNEVVARNLVIAIIERFHKEEGGSFAGKDPTDKGVRDQLALAFVKAKKEVLKGNPSWEPIKIHPRYRVNSGDGVVVKTSAAASTSNRNITDISSASVGRRTGATLPPP